MRSHPRRLVVSALLVTAIAVPAAGSNWERFHGPNGSGTSADTGVPLTWDAATGANIRWKAKLPGTGHSSPVVWDKHLFFQAASADGKQRYFVCLDTTTGAEKWKKAVPGGVGKTHQRSSLASSTPATDGERVVVLFWDGDKCRLEAYDFRGAGLWKRDLGSFTSQHGAGGSPVIYDGVVYVNYDQDGAAKLLAFDAKTGEVRWEKERPAFRACYSAPFVLAGPGGAKELVVGSTAGLTGYEPGSGKVNWEYRWAFDNMALRTVASPIYADGMIVQTSGDGKGDRHAIAVKAGGKGDVSKTHLAWQEKRSYPYVPCMVASGEHVFSVNDKGFAACTVAKTGKVLWTQRLNSPVTASLVQAGGHVYACGEDGKVHVFKAAPSFELVATNDLGEPVYASPAVADDCLFVRGKDHLFCVGKK